MIKVCFYGYSGSGKSTAATQMRQKMEEYGLRTAIYKLAEPLYLIQRIVYSELGISIREYAQNQCLLERVATCIREIDPHFLVNHFLRKLNETDVDVVINDDLRDSQVDMPLLRKNGFLLVRVWCSEEIRVQRLKERADLALQLKSDLDKSIDKIDPDMLLENNFSSLTDYTRTVRLLADNLYSKNKQ